MDEVQTVRGSLSDLLLSKKQHLSYGVQLFIWRLRGKIIRTVPCCVVYNSCAQWYAYKREQFLQFYLLA